MNCLIVYIKWWYFKDIAEGVETRFDTSNYELDRPLPKGKNKKVTGLTKDKLGGKISTKFGGPRAKSYNHLIDDGSEDKKARSTKKCIINRKLKLENYKNCSEGTQHDNKLKYLEKKLILQTQQTFKRESHNVFTEEINKIALGSNDDKRMQSIDLIGTCAYGMSKYLSSEKEDIKYHNFIKQYKKIINFDVTKPSMIQIGHKFLIIHTDY